MVRVMATTGQALHNKGTMGRASTTEDALPFSPRQFRQFLGTKKVRRRPGHKHTTSATRDTRFCLLVTMRDDGPPNNGCTTRNPIHTSPFAPKLPVSLGRARTEIPSQKNENMMVNMVMVNMWGYLGVSWPPMMRSSYAAQIHMLGGWMHKV
jgi:hypothetical protein